MSTLPLPSPASDRGPELPRAENEALRIRGENHLALVVAIRRAVHLVLLALIPPGSMGTKTCKSSTSWILLRLF